MPKEAKSKKQSKDKKNFTKDFKAELKKVVWPTPKQLANNTVAVITIVLITAVIVFVLDFTFETMNKYGIDKIKSVVETSNTTTNPESVSNEVSNETLDNTEISDENTDNTVNE